MTATFRPAKGKLLAAIAQDGKILCVFKTIGSEAVGQAMADGVTHAALTNRAPVWSSRQSEAACAAIAYVLANQCESPMEFLQCWNEGNFEALRKEWENIPEEVFIGADQFHPLTPKIQLYTCKGKGGDYELIGRSMGAGKAGGEVVMVYQNVETGELFHRWVDDFETRMELQP